MENIVQPQNITMLYDTFLKKKKKERFDVILEPLQAIIQLALLSHCPSNTKVTIQNNILNIQLPYISQGMLRWYQNDNKEDLFYLFHACKRFSNFYSFLKVISDPTEETDCNLYSYLILRAKTGIDKLIETYSHTDHISILHTLQIYKLLLDNPSYFESVGAKDKDDIENIFNKIKEVYNNNFYFMILNMFLDLEKIENNDEKLIYIDAMNSMLRTKYSSIQKWIKHNIVF